MALPFVLGLAIGAGAVFAYNKSEKLKSKGTELLSCAKSGLEKTKENVSDLKDTLDATKECIKEKKDKLQEETINERAQKEEASK